MNTFKKTLSILLLMLLVVMSVNTYALADSTMRINADAKISVVPDIAKISIDFETEKPTVMEAQSASNSISKEIVNAIISLDIPKEDIITSEFHITPVYEYEQVKDNEVRHLKAYKVIHSIAVTVKDIKKLGSIIDISIKNGAVNAYNIEYFYSKYDEVYIEALKQATTHANLKAKAIAESSGSEILNIKNIEEIKTYSPYYTNYKRSLSENYIEDSSSSMEIMTGNIIINAEISIEYFIK